VIFSPLESDKVSAGNVPIRGVAWNDGFAPITRVEVSTDGGKSWQDAEIETPESPFAWYKWKTTAKLDKGQHQLRVRATDSRGRSQPMDGTTRWNPKGYEWNGVDLVKVTVS
jgi:sulfite oxidase